MIETTVDLTALTAEFKQAMQTLYGDRLLKVILYGSYARGDFHEESDVDFLIVLRGEKLSKMREMDTYYPTRSALSKKYGIDISVTPVEEKRFIEKSDFLFFRNVAKDGILL